MNRVLGKKKEGDDLLYHECSTIGAARLNVRVRDGNGWDPCARITFKFGESGILDSNSRSIKIKVL